MPAAAPSSLPSFDQGRWVDAAPFRAHLRYLCSSAGLPWQVVALHAGLTLRHADVLLHGRRGRPLRRLPRPAAQLLWQVDVAGLRALQRTTQPSDPTSTRLSAALARGLTPRHLCRVMGWSPARLTAVLGGEARRVSAVDALRARALTEALDRISEDPPVVVACAA